MELKETASAICDNIWLTDENERFWFIQGYFRGATDAKYEAIKDALAALSKNTIPHETR